MKNIFIIIFLAGFYFLFKTLPGEMEIQSLSTLLVGIILLISYLFANIVKKVRLPKLTGYMFIGIIIGPIGLKYINTDIMTQLDFLENLALAFIAINAGGELDFKQYRSFRKSIFFILIFQILIVFIGIILLLLLLSNFIPFFSNFNKDMIYGFAILFAGAAVSKSPATTIGIITETDAKGRNTDIVLAVTLLKSIILVAFFPIILAWSKIYLIEYDYNSMIIIKEITLQIFGSIGMGIVIGILIIWYLKKVKIEMNIFLFCVAITISELTQIFGIEILLTSIIAGIIVRNFSLQGKTLIAEIEIFSLPLYIIFFCLAGANLHLDVLTTSLVFTLTLIVFRLLMIYLGTYIGASIAKENQMVKHHSWMAYVGQAGIALGLGVIIKQNIPGQIGQTFLTILIATVVINELLGPILFKHFLVKAKETKIE
jgi:Kef-type K+ transport system membrane component KefB